MNNFVKKLIRENEFKCNADAREAIAASVMKTYGKLPEPHHLDLKNWADVINYAIEVGGEKAGTTYQYLNAQGNVSTAQVCGLYDIPAGLINPVLVCFSGYMPAFLYTLEAYKAYKLKNIGHLRLFATGKGGNKGLFANVFNRENGLMIQTEAEAYRRMLEQVLGEDRVRNCERAVADIDTRGNFAEMYQLAKAKGWNEATFILCSGQPWYTKRLLAEGMLELGKPEYADVKLNLIVLDCPLTLDSLTPEGHLTEIMLGYIAASLGPLTKDTTPLTLETPDFSKERYLLPGVADADWAKFEELITNYSNMGWPNYQELLYGVDHETAVYNIMMAHLRAKASFTPERYDEAIQSDLDNYLKKISPKQREMYFAHKVYLKLGWYDRCRHHTEYTSVPYLTYKMSPLDDWRPYLEEF